MRNVWDRTSEWLLRAWSWLVKFLSAEGLLERRANGGAIIVLRSAWLAFWALLIAIALSQGLDPNRSAVFSWTELRLAMAEKVNWYGALLGAAYAGLYARFASQWTYVAGVYNQIKAAEAKLDAKGSTEAQTRAIAHWKAGFIEDADDLHLTTKPSIATTISHWLKDEGVRSAFLDDAGGVPAVRLAEIEGKVGGAVARHRKKYEDRALKLGLSGPLEAAPTTPAIPANGAGVSRENQRPAPAVH